MTQASLDWMNAENDRGDQHPDVKVFPDARDRIKAKVDLFLRALRPDLGAGPREQKAAQLADDLWRAIVPLEEAP